MQNRKDFRIENVFVGPEYDKFYGGNTLDESSVILKGETYVKNQEERITNETANLTKPVEIKIDDDILSKHVLILGGIGMGKTNTFLSMTSQLSQNCKEDDVMVIFDTKGDFYKNFGSKNNKKDVFISNACLTDINGEEKYSSESEIWNIFKELDTEKLAETTQEISGMIFADLMKNSSQPFFPMAARAIFTSVLRNMSRNADLFNQELSNKLLKEFFDGKDVWKKKEGFGKFDVRKTSALSNIIELLSIDDKEKGVLNYLSPDGKMESNGQTQGVIAELRLVIDQLFVGVFAKYGTFSIKEAVRERKGKKIYIQYDITEGSTLTPIYSLMVDLAIKEALESRNGNKGNAYFIVDEFKLLPNLKHLDDAVNFGRSIGVKFIIGVQNVSQIIENYGRDQAMNILSGFSTVIAYRVTDYETRKYLVELFGENKKRTAYLSAISSRGVVENLEKANVVEDWDILNLGVGECIIRLAKKYGIQKNDNPFFFRVARFK